MLEETHEEMPENGSRLIMEATGITKVFPGTTALQDVDFKIYSGKVNVLVVPTNEELVIAQETIC